MWIVSGVVVDVFGDVWCTTAWVCAGAQQWCDHPPGVCGCSHQCVCANHHYLCGCVELVLEVLNWCVWVVLTPFCLIQSVGM